MGHSGVEAGSTPAPARESPRDDDNDNDDTTTTMTTTQTTDDATRVDQGRAPPGVDEEGAHPWGEPRAGELPRNPLSTRLPS